MPASAADASPRLALLRVSPLLRWSLRIDALVSAVAGLGMAVQAVALSSRLGLPEPLLQWAGLFALCYGAALGGLSRCARLPRWAVLAVVAGNALWALDCVALALGAWTVPTALGVGFLLAQAIMVGALAGAQFVGMRRSPAVPRYAVADRGAHARAGAA